MKRDALFYKANFTSEVDRMLKALEENDLDKYLFCQKINLKIINRIIFESKDLKEIKKWKNIHELVSRSSNISEHEKTYLRNVGMKHTLHFLNKYL